MSLTLIASGVVSAEELKDTVSTNDQPVFNMSFLRGSSAPEDLTQFMREGVMPGRYRVDIYTNNNLSGRRDVLFQKNASGKVQPCIRLDMLQNTGIDLEQLRKTGTLTAENEVGCLDLPALIASANVTYDPNTLRLDLSVPQVAMLRTARGYVDPALWDEGVNAGFIDYNLSTSRSNSFGRSSDRLYLGLRNGINIGAWRLRNEASFSQGSEQASQYQSNRTYAQRDITSLKGQLTLGESYTSSDIFDSFRFRGLQIGSDDAMLPDSERGYAPVVHGVADSNATVEIRQNGYLLYSTVVAPGPFAINDVFPTGSNGDLEVKVIEADGRERVFTQAFSSLPVMVRKDGIRYNFTAGQYDTNLAGQKTPTFGLGTLVYGVTDTLTTYGGVLFSDGYQAVNLGLGKNTEFGAFSADVTHASSKIQNGESNQGQSARFLYAKTISATDTNFTVAGYRYSTEGYRTLSQHVNELSFVDGGTRNEHQRSRFNLSVSQSLGERASLYLSMNQSRYWNRSGLNKSIQAGYSNSWKSLNYSISLSHNRNPEYASDSNNYSSYSDTEGTQINLSFNLPLGPGSTRAFANAVHDSDGGSNIQTGISGYLNDSNTASYSLQGGHSESSGSTGSASLNVDTAKAKLGLGYSQGQDYRQGSMNVSGSMVIHAGGITLGQPVGESFALVSVPDVKGVGLSNYSGVQTDGNGYAILPYTNPYRLNQVSLDTQNLGGSVEIDNATQQMVPRRGSIIKANFVAQNGHRVQFDLNLANGERIPFGAIVKDEKGKTLGIVDNQSKVLLFGIEDKGSLEVKWGDDQQCVMKYQLPEFDSSKNYVRVNARCDLDKVGI